MTLDEHLKQQHIKQTDFAISLGVRPAAINAIARRRRRPGKALARRISAATKGAVSVKALRQPVIKKQKVRALCDLCSASHVRTDMVRQEERYGGHLLVLYFCNDFCQEDWEVDDPDSQPFAHVGQITGTCEHEPKASEVQPQHA